VLDCQPDEGAVFVVFLAYSTVCPLLGSMTTALIVILFSVTVFNVGASTAAPASAFISNVPLPELPS